MKKILLVLPSFQHGGTVRSARSFVEKNNDEEFEIDVFCMQRVGEFESYFKKCNILNENVELASFISLSVVFSGYSFLKKIVSLFYYFKSKVFGRKKDVIFSKVAKKIAKKKKYDCVLAFQEGLATEFTSYIPIEKKIAWVRCDYSRYYKMVNVDESNIYKKFTSIICVSKYTANKFIEYIPSVKEKVYSIYNLIDFESIINDSKKEITDDRFDNSVFTMVSIGRMDPVKQFTKIPIISKMLVENECEFKWYIIGDGGKEKEEVIKLINDYKLQNYVYLLGAKENPYSYIKKSDLLVCLSSSEACPNVINEAKILHIPILSNTFPTVFEFVINEYNGILCEIEDMHVTIKELINNKNSLNIIKENIKDFVYDNEQIMTDIYNLILED